MIKSMPIFSNHNEIKLELNSRGKTKKNYKRLGILQDSIEQYVG